MNMNYYSVKDGDYTKSIYTMIRTQRYRDAIPVLKNQLETNKSSRACLSLLAYCYFYLQDFIVAAEYYECLSKIEPAEEDYKLYHAQALYQACIYKKAMDVLLTITDRTYRGKVTKLKAAIKFGEEDLISARSLLEDCDDDDPDLEVNRACLHYKEESYQYALSRLDVAIRKQRYNPHISYSLALCYYKLKDYSQAGTHVDEIIQSSIQEHPELGLGMTTEGIEFHSVRNTAALRETALIEACNLKAAIEFKLGNFETACEAIAGMPIRSEEDLDAVTLHNQALMNMNKRPTEGFEKLQFLLRQNPSPPETFGNLLLLYCQYGFYNLAADVIAENRHLTRKCLSRFLYSFIDALITRQWSPDGAFKKFEEMAVRLAENMRNSAKRAQESRTTGDDLTANEAISEYEDALESYISVVMAQAKIYWDLEKYDRAEAILKKSYEFCNDNDTVRLQVANVLFVQENNYEGAVNLYEPVVEKSFGNLLNVNPNVLANLCVSYILLSMNEKAESLMRLIEDEETRFILEDPDKQTFHLSIVNLIIGTLYCSKGNYGFGISRLIRSMDPFQKKLSAETWLHAKRCTLAFLRNLSKGVIFLEDQVFQDWLDFLNDCEKFGTHVQTTLNRPLGESNNHSGQLSVACQARVLKELLIRIRIPNVFL